jgi:hypothetical protein
VFVGATQHCSYEIGVPVFFSAKKALYHAATNINIEVQIYLVGCTAV